jgi:hypothetical protein
MVKYKLQLEDDFEFELFGICSSNADYKLCWGINKALAIQLSKSNDLSVHLKKEGEHFFSFYEYYDDENHLEYYLIKNISSNYQPLIPEKNQIDYFLLLKNNYYQNSNEILTSLKEIDSILTAFIFDPIELKSKGNLIF